MMLNRIFVIGADEIQVQLLFARSLQKGSHP
jgi:hypothetical protein